MSSPSAKLCPRSGPQPSLSRDPALNASPPHIVDPSTLPTDEQLREVHVWLLSVQWLSADDHAAIRARNSVPVGETVQ